MTNILHPTSPSPAIVARDKDRQTALVDALAKLYPEPISIVLEIGCGHGHFLTAYATKHADVQCLGVDIATQRIARSQRKQKRQALNNVAFLQANAYGTLAVLPSHVRLAGIFILFPDPWPKTRHHRRRLPQEKLLDEFAKHSLPDAWIALRTDHAEYFAWARSEIATHPAWRLAPEIAWPFEHSTVFQEMKGPHQSLMAVRK